MSSVRDFIITASENFYKSKNISVEEKSEDVLSDFIHNSPTLLQTYVDNNNQIHFYTEIKSNLKKSVIFYKTIPQDLITGDAINHINIITLTTSAEESLYQIIKQVYSPLLATGGSLYSNKLQKNILDLESNLRALTHGKLGENINVILTIEDEVDYWKSVGQKKDASKKEREAASDFCVLFEDISGEIRLMQSSPMQEIRDSAENIGGILDDVWRYTTIPYQEDRMAHIFDIVGHMICTIIQRVVSGKQLWKIYNDLKDNEVLTLVTESLQVIQTWISACKSLTETYWPNYALHTWNGKPYIPSFCLNFKNRLQEIHDIRSTYNQLSKLLTKTEKEELKTEQLFEAFDNINIWIYNGPNQSWDNAVSLFSANLRPAEIKIAEKLKPRMRNTSTKQMLYEFTRYKTLINRTHVKQALSSELENFVSSLLSLLKNIHSQLDADDVDVRMHQPPEMSPIIQQVQWAKQTEAKVQDIQNCTENYLSEFEGSSEVLKLASQVLKELKDMYTQLHEEWCRDLQAQVKDGSLELSADKPVLQFSERRLLAVSFNPRLVRTELEARALAAAALPPPPAAAALRPLARLLRHARALQQVASFHNTLGERMIPSTRPMMLQGALELSALVQDQKPVYWTDADQLAKYTDKLKDMVLKLEAQNSYLTSQHIAIRNIVEKLLDTELLAKQAEWKKKIKDIRDIIEKVESNGYKNTDMWRSHWDLQIYKALECQYIKALLSLHTHFPHVKIDLILRDHMVQVQPPMEEIRAQHYHTLRRLVALPAQFVGLKSSLAENQSIFATIVEKHSWLGNKAVGRLEAALSGVERVRDAWAHRAALACVTDLPALCETHVREPQHWEINFKACKAYGQAVAKMTFEDEKVEWISIGTVGLRREFEAQARQLWSALVAALQASCRADADELHSFIANAQLVLDNTTLPKNTRELADVTAKQQAVQDKMPQMEQIVESLKKKGHMLRTWGGDPFVDNTIKDWQKIREQMTSHKQMFEHQADLVKSSLNGEWENLSSSVEAWTSRWSQAKPRLEDTRDVTYSELMDRCHSVFEALANFDKYLADRDNLIQECEKFNMRFDATEIWKEAEQLKTEYEMIWSTLKEYHEDYTIIAEQEWMVFQKKLHLLDEFVMKWNTKLEPFTIITIFIKQELEKYSDLSTALKYVRGVDFTERHWREVFSLVGMEYKKSDTLVLKDFLNVASSIKKQMKELQKISSAASNEATIRSALNDLELWYAGARFTIIYNNDKANRQTPIVKDFKEILAKVEEQQWVVSSLGGDASAAWALRLRAARRLAHAAHHAQRRWLYLEPILCNDDGELGTKFRKVDQVFRQVARMIETDSRLSALLQSSRLQPMLDAISEQLNSCQSALNQYIDEKRSIFPRLYFLSDDDLLELLGQARAGAEGRETVMQSHLKKLFPGITGVRLGPGELSITALCSDFGEIFQLDHPVDIDCPVEVWLKKLETEIRSSLQNMTLKCVVTNSLQEQDPFSLPTQILCLAQNIRFTEQAEKAISAKELHKLKTSVEQENLNYAAAEVEEEGEQRKREALILQCTHYMSVVQELIDNNVDSINDWLWQKQLRFYLQNTKSIVAKMGLAEISYSYEYLGVNTGQFVRTEVADECFLILTQALHLGLVGNPFGPAGTGKTESVKALGALVGRLVLIFNCDEAMDATCMGRLLSGLALCGAWGCFDEFNRLSSATLAAVAHQLSSLLDATQQRTPGSEPTALLNGKHVSVSEWCGVAATMNPSGRGYGGRRALPGALARALRPVALRAPPARPLAAHLLAARGLTHADRLATDIHAVFQMASILLSDQQHYDWGLRALKAAIGSCGAALTGVKVGAAESADASTSQRAALRTVLRLNNLSKLTKHDAESFEKILSMVFADVPEEESNANPIYSALDSAVQSLGLVRNNDQIQKCVELYEQLQQRMGVGIVGPPGSGKTTIRKLLKTALMQQGKTIVEYIIYPKAMSRNALLGYIDPDTRQWTDGVISTVAIEVSNQTPDVWSWVVLDGDVEPQWVEALNSVLDDNRLLTLPAGGRVRFARNVNFLFETHCLRRASPATISRIAIILLGEDSSCSSEIVERWMHKAEFENETVKLSVPLLKQATNKCMQWCNSHRSDFTIKFYDISMMKQIISQFEYITQQNINVKYVTPEEIVFRAIQRSVVDILKETAVDSFYDEMREVCGGVALSAGEADTDEASAGEWAGELLLAPRVITRLPAARALLEDPDAHVLILGPDASAKNLIADYILKDTNSTVITIDCTPILEPSDIIEELKRHNVLGAGGSGRATLAVRSLHRARIDSWGSCPVHSFLLQVCREGGAWCAAEGEAGPAWRRAARLRLLAAARYATLAPRLAAALAVVALPEPEDDELLELSKNYLKENIPKNMPEVDIPNLAQSLLSIYKEVVDTFYSKPHYKWNPSHLKKWCENVRWYNVTSAADVLTALNAEANIIFKDRLVTEEERAQFNEIAKRFLRNYNIEVYFKIQARNDGIYFQAVDYNEWFLNTQKLINQCLSENENVFGETGVEACSELAVLYTAACRAVTGGVATCVCAAGGGRAAAARLAAAALTATLHTVDDPQHLHAHFRNALSSASEGNRTLLVLCESAVSEDALAYIETLLSARDMHALPATIRPPTQQNYKNRHEIYDLKQNLGIIICLDKDQDNLVDLMEKYPLLYSDSHLVWQERYSEATLRQLPTLIIQRLKKENISENSDDKSDVVPVDGFVKIYNSLESETLRAPCRYVCFVKSYYHIMMKKKETLVKRQNMLTAGVEALRRARTEVATLQAEAREQDVELAARRADAARALQQLAAAVRATTDRKDDMHTLRDNIQRENDKLQARKSEIEAELASVEPIIAAARAAVGDIRPEALSEVRSLRAPPEIVRDILEGVLRLMGIADTSWHSMKNFLSKRGVKEDIRCLDASQVSEEAVSAVQKLVASRAASFEASAARRASAACAPLAAWVRAQLAHAAAARRVRPLQENQRQLMKSLQEAEDELAALSSGLATVDERVAALQQQLEQHTREAAALELRLAGTASTLAAAQALLERLGDEYDAWEADLQNISKEILELNQRSLLAAGYIVYLPDLTEPQARQHIRKWSSLIGLEDTNISIINFLSSTEKQLKWESEGLSVDESALKNAVLIDQALQIPKCGLTPLLIDPDGEAIEWLRKSLSGQPCDFVSQDNDKLQTTLQYAIRLSRVMVVSEVESLRNTWWRDARVLLAARRGADVPPHVAARIATLHFAARPHTLTDQLINYAIQKRNPEMNEKTKEIKQTRATLQRQRLELQENLLSELSKNGDILHDTNLLASLNKTRETSATINEALSAAREVEEQVRLAREAFASSAAAAARVILALRSIAVRRPLLALPTDTVLDVFVDALATSQDPINIDSERVIKYFTKKIIERVLLSLHKKDKYIVVLYLLKHVYDELITDELWQVLMGTFTVMEDQETINKITATYPWIEAESVKKVSQLKIRNEDLFNKLTLDKADMWKEFVLSGDLHIISKLNLNAFEKVAAVSVLRPNSLYRAIVAFVDEILGSGVVSGSGGLPGALRWGGAARPALLLATHAADQLAALASTTGLPLTQVGIEEGKSAWEAGVEKTRGGGWLALAVGASPFPRELRDFLTELSQRPADDFSDDFRLWIVSEDREIPPMISNLCVNVILESPAGVKHNAAGTLSAWRGERPPARLARHLACLALFHALAQERCAYVPLGWSVAHAWGWGEVSASAAAARAAGAGRAARALCGALYAARVAAAPDRRVLAALRSALLSEGSLAHAWRPPGCAEPLPYSTDLQAYITAFDALPEMDSPQLLCLPANCRVAWEANAANDIILGLRELNTTASLKKCDEAAPLKTLLALWKKLMSGCPLIKADYQVENRGGCAGWWRGACGAEARDAARAARALHAALSALAARARTAHAPLPLHVVPDEWQLLWAGPTQPDVYLKEFCHRARAAVRRIETLDVNKPDFMPSEVDLREWLSPRRVAGALRAQCAARLARPPHALRLTADWEPSHKTSEGSGSADGVVVVGLRLCGGEWREAALRASRPAAPPHARAPPLRLRYVPAETGQDDEAASPLGGCVAVPLYSSAAREQLLLELCAPLAADFPQHVAVLNAVALFVASVD
ncbi:cytoplasmic dynein 2 heavy chain 1 [Epargyreus clarus]|uniref:cytoplasmic dynein 2 heavy chain 1 n=1 Tax=Epargyreus clarus TaxID=520877 RepID=UPI003C2F8068